METKTLKTTPKISVKVWKPILIELEKKLDAACLRRDAYLTKVLEVELPRLDEEVSIPNSEAGYNFVVNQLDQLDRKLVSLALPLEVTERLTDICSRKRIVRDAFFNRLFMLLAVSPKTFDRLFSLRPHWRERIYTDEAENHPFFHNGFHPLEAEVNPFWAIRVELARIADSHETELRPDGRVYTTFFENSRRNLSGLNCYVPDHRIPGQVSEEEQCAALDELLAELNARP